MTFVVIPIALVITALAYSLYGAALANLEATRAAASAGRAGAVRAWLDAAGRSLANQSFAAGYVDAQRCGELANAFLRRNSGFGAVRFLDDQGAYCSSGAAISAARPPGADGAVAEGDTGYRLVVVRSQIWIVAGGDGAKAPSVLVVDPNALRQHLRAVIQETRIAMIDANGEVLALDPASEDRHWLPASLTGNVGPDWRAADRSGQDAAFALTPIQGSTFSLLTRYNDRPLEEARYRLIVLCIAQLAMLGLLAFVYARTIRRDVVQWIHGLDAAARSRGLDAESHAKAPTGQKMPSELRSVAESFNALADHVIEREAALKTLLAENRALMLEMHHRIKNSLQVIQSYLALVRRSAPASEVLCLVRVEARVGVLAVAYRLALTPGGIRPIAVESFLNEICGAAIAALRGPRHWVLCDIEWDGQLVVDRAIPLGLCAVETLIVAFASKDATRIDIKLAARDDGTIEFRVDSNGQTNDILLPEKIIKGLANQLGATLLTPRAGQVAAWRFVP